MLCAIRVVRNEKGDKDFMHWHGLTTVLRLGVNDYFR